MKKSLLVLIILVTSFSLTKAQERDRSIVIKMGYQTDYDRFGIGLDARFALANSFRFAPDITYFFSSDNIKGFDVNANIHYLLPVTEDINIYPLAGIGMVNNRWSKGDISHGDTDFGFNIGLGMEYGIDSNSFFNGEFKYSIQDRNNAVVMVGYGIRF
ncbi:MAG: outer membrane beta-barrel protein [Dysgonomonas sp.]